MQAVIDDRAPFFSCWIRWTPPSFQWHNPVSSWLSLRVRASNYHWCPNIDRFLYWSMCNFLWVFVLLPDQWPWSLVWEQDCMCMYCSLAKRGPQVEHLTSLPKREVGALSTVSAFNHERVPTSCLQRLKALKVNNWTQNNVQRNHQQLRSRVLTAHNTPNCTM